MTTTMNILGMSENTRRQLIARARREMAGGDDRLARQLLLTAARQHALRTRHHVDELLTSLAIARTALAAGASGNDASA